MPLLPPCKQRCSGRAGGAETLEVPSSTAQQYTKVSLDDIVVIAREQHMHDGCTISIPQEPQGVYTLSVFSPRAQDEATIHLDQYTGAVLADYRYGNYGFMGKLIALGITLHKGTQFGFMNQLMGLYYFVSELLVSPSAEPYCGGNENQLKTWGL